MSDDYGFRQVPPDEVKKLLDEGYELIDVREDWEWQRGHIPGAKHLVLSALLANPRGHPLPGKVVFQCAVGERSALASEMAVALGVPEVVNLQGGIKAWKEAGLPVEKPE